MATSELLFLPTGSGTNKIQAPPVQGEGDQEMVVDSKPDLAKSEIPLDKFTIEVTKDVSAHSLRNHWRELFNKPLFSDITICIGSEKILAHKAILFLWSPKLRKLIMEKTEIVIEAKPDSVSLHKICFQYMYTGECEITSQEVYPLLEVANEYDVVALKEQCGVILFDMSSSKDIGYFLDLSQKFHLSKLESLCANHLSLKFMELFDSGTLNSLNVSTWKEILKQDSIRVRNEVDLYRAVLEYAKNSKMESQVLHELLPYIRFPFFPVKFLVDEVEKLETKYPFVHQYLHEAYKYKACPSKAKHKIPVERSRIRRGMIIAWSTDKKSPGVKVDEFDGTISHSGNQSTWQSVVGNDFVSSGSHNWHVKINKNVSRWLFIGVADKSWRGYSDQSSGYLGQAPNSWAYGTYPGWGKLSGGQNGAYATTADAGDVISIHLDCDKKTLSFSINGTSQGVAFTNMTGSEYTVAATVYQSGDSISLVDEWSAYEKTGNAPPSTNAKGRRGGKRK